MLLLKVLQPFVELADVGDFDAEDLVQLGMSGKLDHNVSVNALLAGYLMDKNVVAGAELKMAKLQEYDVHK